MNTRKRTGVGVVAAIGACVSCTGGDDGWGGSVETLLNGAVVVHNPAEGLWAEGEGWRLVEDLRIGAVDGAGPEVFGRISGFAVVSDGRIHVLDRSVPEVRVFTPDGAFVTAYGREGGGPGEFANPAGIRTGPDDRVWVIDTGNDRYSIFTADGILAEEERRFSHGNVAPWPGVILEDGRVVDVDFEFIDGAGVRTYSLYGADGTLQDTIAMPEYDGPSFSHATEAMLVSADVPFSPDLEHYLDPRGYLWTGISSDYRIVQQAIDGGDTLRIVEKAYAPVPVSAAEKDAALANLDWFTRQGGRVDGSQLPDEHPSYQAFDTDPLGHLWVRPAVPRTGEVTPETVYAPQAPVFDVFDPEGRFLGAVRSPVPLAYPHITATHVYGITVDDLGVQYIVRLRIEGR